MFCLPLPPGASAIINPANAAQRNCVFLGGSSFFSKQLGIAFYDDYSSLVSLEGV